MSATPSPVPGTGQRRRTPVWDLPLRVFHWALALLVIAQVATATIGGNAMEWHARGGYAILALVLFRIVWGFVGGTHARFADFVRGPSRILAYLRGNGGAHAGHNPLGGWSVLAMLASLLLQATTGLFANDDVMMEGPLARHVSGRVSEIATQVHDINAWVLVSLVALHVVAVLYYLVARRDNLILPMLSGRKPHAPEPARDGGLVRGAAILAGAAAAVYFIVTS
jgi:cytochrome b